MRNDDKPEAANDYIMDENPNVTQEQIEALKVELAPPHRLRCGDTVRQEGQDYDMKVSYADYESGSASWCGWPEGRVEIERLKLVEACTDEQHKAAVAKWLDQGRDSNHDHRRATIERLYRPRAYWRGVIKIVQTRLEQDRQALSGAEYGLQQAEQGPEDV